ncbi:unnamed protein product [Calicophoron daubneyi]|uniref:Uncharacterized protein n=1 Tax=Calicophoron daubneyi TaxID=300641 RepID=A0AAV2TR55_CALDB
MRSVILFGLIFVCLVGWISSQGQKLEKEEFQKCVKQCAEQYEGCTKTIHKYWKNFLKNKKRIMREMVKCCLAGETDRDAPASLSFATCVRDNCNAQMWGCNMKRRHIGFLSEEEKKEILSKEAKRKEEEAKKLAAERAA